jgi:hypothetical protein
MTAIPRLRIPWIADALSTATITRRGPALTRDRSWGALNVCKGRKKAGLKLARRLHLSKKAAGLQEGRCDLSQRFPLDVDQRVEARHRGIIQLV